MRPATIDDAARLAYFILVWDQELPEHLRMVRGDAELAYQTAELMCGDKFVTWVIDEGDQAVGAIAIHDSTSLFGFHRYGNVAGVFVLPKHRGHKRLGLRLLNKGRELKAEKKWRWLEMNPWSTDLNTQRVLGRLGFADVVHTYILR